MLRYTLYENSPVGIVAVFRVLHNHPACGALHALRRAAGLRKGQSRRR